MTAPDVDRTEAERLRVCLVRPPAVDTFRFATTTIALPLGLAYVAAVLEESGRRPRIVDAVAEAPKKRTRYFKGVLVGLTLEEIARRIPEESDLVGISVIFTHEWPAVVKLIERIRSLRPRARIVIGGEHVTSMPEFSLATSLADFAVLGEGEETIVELVDALESGRPLEEIEGLAFRRDGEIVVNARRKRRRSVDDIPYPAWHLFDVETYNRHDFVGGQDTGLTTLPLLATRGCPYQCSFCSSPNMWTPLWVPRDPIKVVDEIEHHVERFGARNFVLQDLTAIVRKDWTVTFCHEILRRGLDIRWQFPSGTRCEAVDAEVADLMRRTNMVHISYAPESGSERTRRVIKKKMRTEALLDSIRASADAGLNVAVFLIVGFPHEDDDAVAENVAFVEKVRRLGAADLGIGYFFALPGTELFDCLYDAGRIRIDRDYFRHILQGADIVPTVSHAPGLGRLGMMKWKWRLYRKFYSTPLGNKPRSGFLASLWLACTGFFRDSHETKLQTVFRHAASSLFDTLRTWPTRGWIPRREEKELFADWDAVFRRIRERLREERILEPAPSDPTALEKSNVVRRLRGAHETPRRLPAAAG